MFAERHPLYLVYLLLGAASEEHNLGLTEAKARDRLKQLLPGTDVDKIIDNRGDPDVLHAEMIDVEKVYLIEELALERAARGETGETDETDESPNAEININLRSRRRGLDVDLSGGDISAAMRQALAR